MGDFSYPILRHGEIFSLETSLNFSAAEKVAKAVEEGCTAENFVDQMSLRTIGGTGLTRVGDPEIFEGSRCDLWEGWVAYSPAISITLDGPGGRYEIRLRFSTVSCMEPNNSKIWTSGMLLRRGDNGVHEPKEADGLNREEAQSFFDAAEALVMNLAEFAAETYREALKATGLGDGIESVKTVSMRVMGSHDQYHEKLENEVRSGEILQLSKEVAEAVKTEQGLKDTLFFIFGRDIVDFDDFYQALEAKKAELGIADGTPEAEAEERDEDPLDMPGVHWFGFKYDEGAAVFFKEKAAAPGAGDFYIGFSPEHGESSLDDLDTIAAFKSSKDLVKFVSPFL